MLRTIKCIAENKTKVLRYILPSFFMFPFFYLSLKGNEYENFCQDFSGTTWPRILKSSTKLGNEQLYCVLKNQPHIAYQSLYLSIFLSL